MTEKIGVYLRAKYPALAIPSVEEWRVLCALAETARALRRPLRRWSIASGFVTLAYDEKTKAWGEAGARQEVLDPMAALSVIDQSAEREVVALCDFHPFLTSSNPANVPVIRAFRELCRKVKNLPPDQARTIVLLSAAFPDLAPEVKAELAWIDWPLPDAPEIKAMIEAQVASIGDPAIRAGIVNGAVEEATRAALGLTLDGAQNCIARSLVTTRRLDPKIVSAEKKQAVAASGAVEWINVEELEVGGLEVIQSYAVQRRRAFGEKARAYGLPAPKGIVLVGVPGAGKSLTAKYLALLWQQPLLRLDVGSVFGALVGQSEEQIRQALKLAEAVAPCILWLDEIEKGFAGLGAGAADAGTSARVFGTFLTWMQEKKAPVFVLATSNDVSALPPELLRKGRFDEIFFVSLPTTTERRAIWGVQLRKYRRDPTLFDVDRLVTESLRFTGAEIEAAVVAGLSAAFAQDREVVTEDIVTALLETTPLAKTASEKITALLEWAKGRARNASLPEAVERSGGVRQLELDPPAA